MFDLFLRYPENPAHRTEWHPTERFGPFKVLNRGRFQTEAQAREWAFFRHIHSDTYEIRPAHVE